jgi:hypothetical protein
MDPSISGIQLLQGILAAMALNRALTSIHFKSVGDHHEEIDETQNSQQNQITQKKKQ